MWVTLTPRPTCMCMNMCMWMCAREEEQPQQALFSFLITTPQSITQKTRSCTSIGSSTANRRGAVASSSCISAKQKLTPRVCTRCGNLHTSPICASRAPMLHRADLARNGLEQLNACGHLRTCDANRFAEGVDNARAVSSTPQPCGDEDVTWCCCQSRCFRVMGSTSTLLY